MNDGLLALAVLALALLFASRRWRWPIPRRRHHRFIAVLILALILRVYHMDNSMWYDETFSAAMASLSLPDLMASVHADVHPPLYYLILWFVAQVIGTSEIALRAPALAFGLLSVLITYPLTKKLFKSRDAALIAMLIVAVLPAHIRYSVEARAYMLMVLAVQIALYAILTRNRALFILSAAGLPLLHAYGYIYAGGLFAGWTLLNRRPAAVLAAFVPGAAWLPFIIQQTQNVTSGFWIQPPSVGGVVAPVASMTLGQVGGWDVVLTTTAALVLAGLSIPHALKRLPRRVFGAWTLVIVGVPAGALVVTLVVSPVWLDRALLPAAVMLIPAWASLVLADRRAALILLIALPVASVSFAANGHKDDLRSWITNCKGEAIYTLSVSTAVQALYYSDGRPVYVWSLADDISQRLPHDVQSRFGIIVTDAPPSVPVCVPFQYSPYHLTAGYEVELFRLLFGNQYRSKIHRSTPSYRFMTYEIEGESQYVGAR